MSDQQLQYGISELVKRQRIDGLVEFYVELHQGVAVVHGTARSNFAKWACCECCRHTPGVVRVVDEVQIAAHVGAAM